jgi:tetratricopeptide (TPR) repeat protein
MKRLYLTTALMVLAAGAALAEPVLYINTAPIRAEVTVNGSARGATPLVLRDLPAGEYEITAAKPGFRSSSTRVVLSDDAVESIEFDLEPAAFVASFSAAETVVGAQTLSRQESTLVLPSGTYELATVDSALRIQPVYPNESALIAARIITLAAGVTAAISTVEDAIVADGRSFFTSYLPSAGSIAAWVTTIGGAGFWIALESEKRSYTDRVNIELYEAGLTAAEAESLYLEGDQALEAGNLGRALGFYTRIVADSRDSEYLPQALYKSAQIYSLGGDVELAAQIWERLLSDYPAVEVYDRALKSLSDMYIRLGRYNDALARLDQITFIDPLFTPEDIEQDRAEIESLQEEAE